ncbi:RagB/SusD family nutrient uptake outer membrane protein [Pseudoflavitalea sp. X16]|uniref:RagB/SusD family nutrient uptake outer membrane protein n=1 Tax=Paraflavitalea devenefica TaxID=2716334 RepID=UPI001423E4F5|nr:RagB/SusD family nutrient uptake outer membrane protein [Paraflavitalea devenefica]NII27776.1 RagB/SusD family nutrient uptake outer membrane protein [Paraflavitalea devenefica]
MQNRIVLRFIVLLLLMLPFLGCRKIIDMQPITEVDASMLYADDQTAVSAVVGLENRFMTSISMFNGNLSRYLSLYGDDLKRISKLASDSLFYNHLLSADNEQVAEFWNSGYSYIFHCNAILTSLQHSEKITPETKNQLQGETKFIRSLVYFYLVNLFDSIPLVLVTDPQVTKHLPRAAPAAIYAQLVEDLQDAQALLSNEYPANRLLFAPRTRVNKGTAAALLARVYLYRKDYAHADTQSTWVIGCGQYTLEPDLNKVFLKDSPETIFALHPTINNYNTVEGKLFGLNPTTNKAAFEITPALWNSFEAADQRAVKWITTATMSGKKYKIPYKYKVYEAAAITEYNVLFRLADLYLIRAEARAALGHPTEAVQDLNTIRARANATLLSSSLTGAPLKDAIEAENRREYFTESGHRWLDLRRWESHDANAPHKRRADDVMEEINPQHWASYKIHFPIPGDELLKSKFLTQNPGY